MHKRENSKLMQSPKKDLFLLRTLIDSLLPLKRLKKVLVPEI